MEPPWESVVRSGVEGLDVELEKNIVTIVKLKKVLKKLINN